ncbi:hypothetical protein Tco_0981516 [Tanacetum coccineum]
MHTTSPSSSDSTLTSNTLCSLSTLSSPEFHHEYDDNLPKYGLQPCSFTSKKTDVTLVNPKGITVDSKCRQVLAYSEDAERYGTSDVSLHGTILYLTPLDAAEENPQTLPETQQ